MIVPEPPPHHPVPPYQPVAPYPPAPHHQHYQPVVPPAAGPRRSPWRKPWVLTAIVAGVVVNMVGLLFAVLQDEDGKQACWRIARVVQEADYASVTFFEADKITSLMEDSLDDDLSALGRRYRGRVWRPVGTGRPLAGADLVTDLVEDTREPCRRISEKGGPWPF
ncbi:hypothetical protein [Catenuloplanes japonicus]|uniref:hypothetical protein n=1 Tax=Catenuloplanes japonicus TaxID=33876 RepID=UPI0012FAB0B7|nr:hypothetical protein [Catenuloplanes japonicus]